MPIFAAVLTVGGSLIAADMAASGAENAAQTQADAALRAAEIQAAERAPWVEAGKTALQRLQTGLAPGGEFRAQFSMADAMNAPAMRTALATGREAIEQSAASRGGLLTSNTLAGLTDYGQKVGAQYQNQAFNQYLAQLEANLKPIQSLAQVGQTEVGRIADVSSNAALAAGGALAGSQVAQGNIYGSAVSNLGKQLGQMNVLQGLFGGGGGGVDYSLSTQGVNLSSPAMGGYTPPAGYGGTFGSSDILSGGVPTLGMGTSDMRAKRDARPVGKTFEGDTIYTYRMVNDDEPRMGVMAQELAQRKPQAVQRGPSGYLMVDYDMVG
jgi:hypothetical protein